MFLFIEAQGQVGIRGFYNANSVKKLDNLFLQDNGLLEDDKTFNQGFSVSLDYWLRMQQYRVEFYPYISYSHLKGIYTPSSLASELNLLSRSFGLGVNTHIYFLDFEGDCDCPTFSKQNGFVKKGLFALVGLGGGLTSHTLGIDDSHKNRINATVSFGFGIDIGISDLITISPILQYNYLPFYSWPEIFELRNQEAIKTPLGQLQLGIRIGLRADYKK